MWRDLAYPGQAQPHGVLETSIAPEVRSLIEELAPRVAQGLKTEDRNVLGDCGFATLSWASVLASAGVTVRRVGGFGEHEVTVPPTPVEQLGGYLTDDDGLVQHWWLMVDPDGSLFDPTAHQFDARGGIRLERYRVEGSPVHRWRLEWPTRAGHFPAAGAAITPNPARRLLRR
jgi:hypothetical protein